MVAVRLKLMGSKAPEFAPADNPSSDSPFWLTRTLTFLHLPAFNLWLLIQPSVLSFDWSMEAIPLIHSFADLRNVITLVFYSTLAYAGWSILVRQSKKKGVLESADDASSSNDPTISTEELASGSCASAMLISSALLAAASDPTLISRAGSNGYHHHPCCSPPFVSSASSTPCTASLAPGYSNVIGSSRSSSSAESCGSSSCSSSIRSERTRWSSSSSRSSIDGSSSSSSSSLRKSSMDLTVIALSMMVLPFIPATNLFFYVGFVVAERVLYIPSMGYCLLIALGCHLIDEGLLRRQQRRPQERNLLRHSFRIALLLLLVFYAARTVRRNQDWLTEESLYRSGININPPKGNLSK